MPELNLSGAMRMCQWSPLGPGKALCRNDDPAEIQGASRNWLREGITVAGREVWAEGAAWLKVQIQEDIVPEGLNGGSHWRGGWAGREGWTGVMLERTGKQAQLTGERTRLLPQSNEEALKHVQQGLMWSDLY